MRKLQIVIVPFARQKGELVAVGHLPAATQVKALEKAGAMAGRYDGVGVYGVWVDDITLDASDLEELGSFGHVPALSALQAAA